MANACLLPLAALLAFCPTPFSVAYPNGAPTSACEGMKPQHHDHMPQTSKSPYTITADKATYKNGEMLNVQITGPGYLGALMLVQDNNSKNILGTWINPPENTKLLQCSGMDGSAVTHANKKPKTTSTTYSWMAPDYDCPEAVIITATVVEQFEKFWTGITCIVHRDAAATCGSGGSGGPGSAFGGSGSPNVNGNSSGSDATGSPDLSGSTVGSDGSPNVNGNSSGSDATGSPDLSGSTVGSDGSSSGYSDGPGSPGEPCVTASSGDSDACVSSGADKVTWTPTIVLLMVVHMCPQLGRLRQRP